MTLASGMESVEQTLQILACDALDAIATYAFKSASRVKTDPEASVAIEVVKQSTAILLQVCISSTLYFFWDAYIVIRYLSRCC